MPEMPPPPGPAPRHTVALSGFSDFERSTLASFFRLAAQRTPSYVRIGDANRCDFLVADADHAATLAAVLASGRARDTVFIGAHAPGAGLVWLPRPIAPTLILRELDRLAAQRALQPPADTASPQVDLLLQDVALPAEPADAQTESALPGARGGGGREVLVVEDSAIARRFLSQRLQRLGYRVHGAESGEQALELLAQLPVSVVFLDIQLGPPGSVDGLHVCQAIKHRGAHAPGAAPAVVMCTGLGGPSDRVRGSLAGCDAYLVKPLMEAEFIRALRSADTAFEWDGDTLPR